METLRVFNVHLADNHLTANPNDKTAHIVAPVPTRTKSDLVNSIMAKRTDYEKSVVAGIVDLACECLGEFLLSGISYQDDNFRFSPTVRGTWEGTTAVFDPEKNKVDVNVSPTAAFRKELETVHVNVLGERHDPYFISLVLDESQNPEADKMVPGEELTIIGKNIKVTPIGAPGVGVFFTSTAGQITPVTHRIIINTPGKVMVRVPDGMVEEDYTLTIVTQGTTNTVRGLKEPRTITFDRLIRIGAGPGEFGKKKAEE